MGGIKKAGLAAILLASLVGVGSVAASWNYANMQTSDKTEAIYTMAGDFKYSILYITDTQIVGGEYAAASITDTDRTNVGVDLQLNADGASTVLATVTFYNATELEYYYNGTQTLSTDNANVVYTVAGMEKGDVIAAGEYRTLTVTFSYADTNDFSANALLSEIRFNFVEKKEEIVAGSAVEKFEEILNDEGETADALTQLTEAMDGRGSTFNKESSVTYIGNVAGANNEDSTLLESLFGTENLSMDLNGDGVKEPITMMIKRENLDNDETTGGSYTYTQWGRETTVKGVEMTIYITADSFEGKSQGEEMLVYAAVYTVLPDADGKWVQIVGLTSGKAQANNYTNGPYGTANSFNTETWKSTEGSLTIKTLVANAT